MVLLGLIHYVGIRKELFCVALKILESIDEFVRTEYGILIHRSFGRNTLSKPWSQQKLNVHRFSIFLFFLEARFKLGFIVCLRIEIYSCSVSSRVLV